MCENAGRRATARQRSVRRPYVILFPFPLKYIRGDIHISPLIIVFPSSVGRNGSHGTCVGAGTAVEATVRNGIAAEIVVHRDRPGGTCIGAGTTGNAAVIDYVHDVTSFRFPQTGWYVSIVTHYFGLSNSNSRHRRPNFKKVKNKRDHAKTRENRS